MDKKIHIFDLVKKGIESYSNLPYEKNLHLVMSVMWKTIEVLEDGFTDRLEGEDIELEDIPEEYGEEGKILEIVYLLCEDFSKYFQYGETTSSDRTDEEE